MEKKANFVENEKLNHPTLLLASIRERGIEDNAWYPDTGAINHMCGSKNMFVETIPNFSKRKGNIHIHLKDGSHQFFFFKYLLCAHHEEFPPITLRNV